MKGKYAQFYLYKNKMKQRMKYQHEWCDMGIRCVGVGVCKCQSEDSFVFVQSSHKGLAREISLETGRGLGKESHGENRERGWTKKSTGESSQQKSREADCWNVWIQRPGWPTWEDESAFLVTLWEFRSNTRSG